VLGRKMNPEDYIFGTPGANGVINHTKPVSHDVVQNWITTFAKAAGINLHYGSFTTHCFRRGGAQYRFMWAPTGKRWALHVVRWWGGWSEGEHVSFHISHPSAEFRLRYFILFYLQKDSMIRYLLDEVHFLESNHSDAMRPVQMEPGKSLLGEEKEERYLTFGDAKDLFSECSESLVHRFTDIISATLSRLIPAAPIISNSPPIASTSTLPPPVPSGSAPSVDPPTRHTDIGQFPVASFPPGLKIPTYKNSPRWWLNWVKDWEYENKDDGLFVALKDWPKEWRTGRLRGRYGKQWNNRRWVRWEYVE
jgi:hypothetical protein